MRNINIVPTGIILFTHPERHKIHIFGRLLAYKRGRLRFVDTPIME
jgi:hypothetical protein